MWKQGEHVALVGATQSGKTYLANRLLRNRKYRIMLVSKTDRIQWAGWRNIKRVSQIDLRRDTAYRLIPEYAEQAVEFWRAMEMAWLEGGWCIYVDEMYYVQDRLGLSSNIIQLLTQGASKYISVMVGMQRPAWVTKFAVSEPVHVLSFRLGDRRDVKTLVDASGSQELGIMIPRLARYQFAYLNKLSGEVMQGNAKDLVAVGLARD